jgi:predicted GNAT family acetyltransferase
MKITKHENIDDFLVKTEKLLLEKESFHNLILGLAQGIQLKKIEPQLPLYYSVEDQGKTIAAALRSNAERPFVVTEMPTSAVDFLIKDLIEKSIELKSVVGEERTATYFKDQWIKIKKLSAKINIHLGIYECSNIIFPKEQKGEIHVATDEFEDVTRSYITGFLKDCFPNTLNIPDEVSKMLKHYFENKSLYLLKNESGEVVSMAANTRSTSFAGTISLVYTPPELRGKGHASLMVALLSEKIMNDGKKFCNLFTDLTNPTSNSIYQKIGYVKIGQNIHFDFISFG